MSTSIGHDVGCGEAAGHSGRVAAQVLRDDLELEGQLCGSCNSHLFVLVLGICGDSIPQVPTPKKEMRLRDGRQIKPCREGKGCIGWGSVEYITEEQPANLGARAEREYQLGA